MRCFLVAVTGLAAILMLSIPAFGSDLEVYCSDAPPLTMATPGMNGIAADLVLEAAKRAGHAVELLFLPWPRAQMLVAEGKDKLIIPLTRTPEREQKYTWIAPFMEVGLGFAALDKVPVDYDEARKKLQTVVLLRSSIGKVVLPRHGFSEHQLMEVSSLANVLEILELKRAGAWFDSIPVLRWTLKQHPESAHIKIGPPVETVSSYVACSKDCSADLADGLRKAIAEIKADGTFDRILSKYQ